MLIDFHTHILPEIDDGSRNVEMSLNMLAAQREQQVDEIVATPHFYAQKDSVEEFLLRRQRSYEKLKTKMAETNLDQKLHLAAEVYYFQGIGSAGMIPKLCVEGTQTLLLEMPFAQWDSAVYADVEKLVQRQKLKVVIAHIERYYEFQKKKEIWNAVMELPLYRQMNAGVFLNWKKRHKAFQLAKEATTIILGSDCHNMDTSIRILRGAHRAYKEIWRSVPPENGSPDQGGTAVSEKKKTMRAVIEIIIAVLVISAVYFIIRGMDRHDVRIRQAATENETQACLERISGKKPSRSSYIKKPGNCPSGSDVSLIGTDKSGNEDAEGEEYHGSMADALMLVVVDKEEKTYGILQLNRDTITEVPMLLQDGSANSVYGNLSIVLILIGVCMMFFLNTCKNVLKRGFLIELAATMRQVSMVILFAVFYLFFVKDAGDFSRITLFLTAIFYAIISYGTRILWKRHVLRNLRLGRKNSIVILTDWANLPQVREDIQHHSYELFQIRGIAVIDVNEKKTLPEKLGDIPFVAEGESVMDYLCHAWWMKYLSICSQMIRG